jgi:hypothetical protein
MSSEAFGHTAFSGIWQLGYQWRMEAPITDVLGLAICSCSTHPFSLVPLAWEVIHTRQWQLPLGSFCFAGWTTIATGQAGAASELCRSHWPWDHCDITTKNLLIDLRFWTHCKAPPLPVSSDVCGSSSDLMIAFLLHVPSQNSTVISLLSRFKELPIQHPNFGTEEIFVVASTKNTSSSLLLF